MVGFTAVILPVVSEAVSPNLSAGMVAQSEMGNAETMPAPEATRIVAVPVMSAGNSCTTRFEPSQSWVEMSAMIVREVGAEMRRRAGFYADEAFEDYELEVQPSGVEIRRWRWRLGAQQRPLASFQLP